MRLADVVAGVANPGDHGDLEVSDVQIDSRLCGEGSLFFALPGNQTSGVVFIDDAVEHGAVAVVSAEPLATAAPTILVAPQDLQRALAAASAAIVSHPEARLRLLGVTGTNGKTSVTTIFAALWRTLGRTSDVIGTLTHERTTPAPPELFRELSELARAPGAVDPLMAIEVSSHALTQGRVDGLTFDLAIFTNLSHEHLDYHGSMEAYFRAKSSLFTPDRCRRAVVFVDDEYGRRLAATCPVPVTRVARGEATDVHYGIGETSFVWRGRPVRTALTGEYNVDNALMVLAASVDLGVDEDRAVAAIAGATVVDGRFEVVNPRAPTVIVDFAHTPAALERILTDARWIAGRGRVLVVFGCGGNRDRTKRPEMGAVATHLADVTVITSNNPRFENPDTIIDEVAAGCARGAEVHRETDRRAAIRLAISVARDDDVVVIAGKGHQTAQVVAHDLLEFDDRVVAREVVAELGRC